MFLLRSKKKQKRLMFRKIVSNLAFSPALVGQLGFYARRLKKEETTRRLGLVFTALALVVQSLTVFTPPESANAANGSDFIYGGISTKKALLAEYDKKRSDFKDIMDYAGITRAELANMKEGSINSKGKGTGEHAWQTWGRRHVYSAAQGEVKHVVPLDTGGSSTVYSKPLWLYDSKSYTIANGSTYPAFVGHSAKRGDFAIMKDCANLVTTSTPKANVEAHFIAASCEMIRGKAIDSRDKNARIKVFLYFDGPPGKGEKSEPIYTQASDNTFSVAVPAKYKKRADSTKVWGVMIPLAGWHDSTVQFESPVSIPGGCVKPQAVASCSELDVERISRTDFKLSARASADNGAKIKSYTFTVTDGSNKTVMTKDVTTAEGRASSGKLTLATPGSYTAQVTVKTSEGAKSGPNCRASLSVASAATPAVHITKHVDNVKTKTVGIDQEFSYQIAVTNTGEVALKNVAVSDSAPQGVTLLSASTGIIKGNAWNYQIANLKGGETVTFTLKAKVATYVSGQLKNTACVNASEVNPGQPTTSDGCDDATVTVSQPIVNPCASDATQCAQVTESKSSTNLTQGVDAASIKAQASDRIEYTVYLENIGTAAATRTISEDLTDVLEYATVMQNGGGEYDAETHVLSWKDVSLQPGEKTSRSFVVQLLDTIPVTARGESEPSSYDCIMTNAFGNTVDIPVACSTPKLVETTVEELPKTGPGANLLFAGVVGSVVTFFWARSRQLGREVKLIRKDFNMGTI
jgi:uncharacterized repeat protein (TIGR01451 family)